MKEFLRGHAELVERDGRLVPRRLPAGPLHPRLDDVARMPAGVRLEFDTDARGFAWDVTTTGDLDVVVDGELVSRSPTVHVDGLPGGRKRVRIWLPQSSPVSLGEFRLRGEMTPVPEGPRWIAYGSSITQCRLAAGPSETWPALVASELGWSLRCLGFAGECHLDPVVARYIRDTEADVISLCVGVNIHGAASFSARSLGPALEGFVRTIREGHPDTPILLTTPLHAPGRERQPNALGLTLADVRAEVAGAAHGLPVVPGPSILGPADAGLLADGLHPGAEGYRLIARRLRPHLAALLPHTNPKLSK
ncbi:GDSL-type esterase/lipase family protein [Amycolatopsis sp. OK19-0408]|uniref:GDSL-type esterase/lipase family protein n=1 Tax=Amycolatopsis iheyensis TaxID=2945988 RepID=A0A9X2SK78_9PSEU|nr:GDSL-type esterase/lipase family protein [Amycolatopsis iheyensis]MCR6483100.1 GDSL-type esterase/lipase family protein [Amycolatopsis iheyensis]